MSERTTAPFHVQRPAWIDEFRAFIMRGNVIDLAVGIIIGIAFTAVVNSLVRTSSPPSLVWPSAASISRTFLSLSRARQSRPSPTHRRPAQ